MDAASETILPDDQVTFPARHEKCENSLWALIWRSDDIAVGPAET
jgi:hypothetical protein